MAVRPDVQGTGVATALVAHAERRLAHAGLSKVQIEYSYRRGDASSERLFSWYEGALGFVGPTSRTSGFRMCRKRLEPKGARLRWVVFEWLCAILRWLCCGAY